MPETAVARFLLKWLLVPVLVLWGYHLAQRRFVAVVGVKRIASMLLTMLVLAVWVIAYVFARFALRDLYLAPIAFLVVVVAVWQRGTLFPYRLRCARCARPLSLQRILFHGDSRCDVCSPAPQDKEIPS